MLPQQDGRMVTWDDSLKTLDVGATNDGRPPALTTIIQGTNLVTIGSNQISVLSSTPVMWSAKFCGRAQLVAGAATINVNPYNFTGIEIVHLTPIGAGAGVLYVVSLNINLLSIASSNAADARIVNYLILTNDSG